MTIQDDEAASLPFSSLYQRRDGLTGALAVTAGGTGAKTAAAARTALGVDAAVVASDTVTLSSGTIVVNDANVAAATTVIRLSHLGPSKGAVYVSAVTDSTSFAITSTDNTDDGKIHYEILVY